MEDHAIYQKHFTLRKIYGQVPAFIYLRVAVVKRLCNIFEN